MIRISNLSFTYPGSDKPNLREVSLDVKPGDFLAIVGSNGCGKSTLCKAIIGLIPHFFNGDYEGNVEVCGMDTREHGIGELALKVGYVYQDFENQIVRPTVLDDASFACLNYAMENYIEKGMQALQMADLSHKAGDFIWQLSGGEKHLLALAGALALGPDILILDEPVAQLDPRHAKNIYQNLKKFNETYKKTIIVIEHHTEFIAEYCKNVVLMREGKIVWKKPTKEALCRIEELEAEKIVPPQVTIAARRICDMGMAPEQDILPVTIEDGIRFFRAIPFSLPVTAKFTVYSGNQNEGRREKKTEMITFRNVTVEYRAVKGHNPPVLHNFNCDIYQGEKVALIGSNGAGKSTILKLILGLLKPNSGNVSICGIPAKDMTPEELSQKVSLVYQNPEEMFISDSIRGDIEYAMKVREVPGYEQRTDELLEMFHLSELAQRDGRLLSGGQMRRASLAVGIALNPSVLLLDEPTANLDIVTRKEVLCALERLKDVAETVIIASHDLQLVTEWASRIIVLSDGYIIADGTRDEIFRDRHVSEKAGIVPPELYRLGKGLHPDLECFHMEEFVRLFLSESKGRRGA